MASRGSTAKNGHVGISEYKTITVTNTGAKVLEGYDKQHHTLPDYAHTPNSVYVKLKKDGKTLHEMRFYDDKGNPVIEIAYHPEPTINNGSHENVVHFHLFDRTLNRYFVGRVKDHPYIKNRYANYLKEFDLYEKC